MDRLTANRYISLQQKIASSGVPQELVDEVEALDATVNGDETQDPPVVGLVDIVGDLENSVEDLDTTVNGDSTADPPVIGLGDRVDSIEDALESGSLFTVVTSEISNVALSQWGNVYVSEVEVDIPATITATGKMIFGSYVSSNDISAGFANVVSVNDITHKVTVVLWRGSTGVGQVLTGTVYLAIQN